MIMRDSKGIYHIEKRPGSNTPERHAYYDNKFGVDGWIWSEPVCSGLCPECGYGAPHTISTCRFCDGKCLRPRKRPEDDYNEVQRRGITILINIEPDTY